MTILQDHAPNLTALVCITILLSLIPMCFAWKLSPNTHGTPSDVDFYLQIQNSIMMVLGILIGLYPSIGHPSNASRYLMPAFATFGICCSFAAPVLYLALPVMWSALLAFAGTAIQVYMALQAVIIAVPGAVPIKRD